MEHLPPSLVALVVKNLPANAGDVSDSGSIPEKIPWRRTWQHTLILMSGESYGQRSLAGTVHRVAESDATEVTELSTDRQ